MSATLDKNGKVIVIGDKSAFSWKEQPPISIWGTAVVISESPEEVQDKHEQSAKIKPGHQQLIRKGSAINQCVPVFGFGRLHTC